MTFSLRQESFADAGFVGEEFFAEEGFPGQLYMFDDGYQEIILIYGDQQRANALADLLGGFSQW